MWRYGIGRGERDNKAGVTVPYYYLAKVYYRDGKMESIERLEHLGFDSDSAGQVHREIATAALDIMNGSLPIDEEELER